MKIITTKIIPPTDEFIETLKHEFSDHYSYKSFGTGSGRSLIIHKSALIGVELSVLQNEILIDGATPTVEGTFFTSFLQVISGLGISIIQLASLFYKTTPWKKLETEIGYFLQHKYN